MRRVFIALLAAITCGLAVTSAFAQGSTVPSDRSSLTTFFCHRALTASQRVVSVTAGMRPLPGTERLSMRFELLGYSAGRLTAVRGGDLGTWITPHPITLGQRPQDVWIVRHPVTGVPVPALYHFRVMFRWTGADQRTLGTAERMSTSCWQPDMRPVLSVDSLVAQPLAGNAAQDTYTATIANDGLTAANLVQVVFTFAGAPSQSITVSRLRPQDQRQLVFTGPACTATGAPTVSVDPSHRISQRPGGDASVTATCPAQTSSGALTSTGAQTSSGEQTSTGEQTSSVARTGS